MQYAKMQYYTSPSLLDLGTSNYFGIRQTSAKNKIDYGQTLLVEFSSKPELVQCLNYLQQRPTSPVGVTITNPTDKMVSVKKKNFSCILYSIYIHISKPSKCS